RRQRRNSYEDAAPGTTMARPTGCGLWLRCARRRNVLVMAEQVRWVVLALQVDQTLVVRPEGFPDQVGALVGLRAHLVDVEALREGQHRLGELSSPPDMARGFRR